MVSRQGLIRCAREFNGAVEDLGPKQSEVLRSQGDDFGAQFRERVAVCTGRNARNYVCTIVSTRNILLSMPEIVEIVGEANFMYSSG